MTSSKIGKSVKKNTEFRCGGLYEDQHYVVMCFCVFDQTDRVMANNGVILHSKLSNFSQNCDDDIGTIVLDIDSPHRNFTDFRGTLVLES